jgi:hypothetical protein
MLPTLNRCLLSAVGRIRRVRQVGLIVEAHSPEMCPD